MYNPFVKLVSKKEIPLYVERPVSEKSPWNIVPVGIGTNKKKISIDFDKNPHILITGNAGSGKSNLQKLLLLHCLDNSNDWDFIGFSCEKQDLEPYKNKNPNILGYTSLEQAVPALRIIHEEMMNRYALMKEYNINSFKELPDHLKSLMVVIDDANILFTVSGINNDEDKKKDMLRHEALTLVEDMARIGRTSGIHIVISTQRFDAHVFDEELRVNLSCRITMSHLSSSASMVVFGDTSGAEIEHKAIGRSYMMQNNENQHFQSYLAPRQE